MILLYGAGGVPGRGENPMDLIRNQTFDDFPSMGCQGQIMQTKFRIRYDRKSIYTFYIYLGALE